MPKFIATMTPTGLDAFTTGYVEALEWTECDLDHMPDIDDVEGFAPELLQKAKEDCEQFQKDNESLLDIYYETTGRDASSAGSDFWLTRNHHGAGFWDRISERESREGYLACKALSDRAQGYGSVDVYVGDDGLIYTQ